MRSGDGTPPLENPRCGPVPVVTPLRNPLVRSVVRWDPTVDRDRGPGPYPVGFLDFLFFGDDDVVDEGSVDEVILVEKSGTGGSAGSILVLSREKRGQICLVKT